MFLSIQEFFGHFHPLLVHLPIGILLTGILLQWLSHSEKFKQFQQAVPVVLLCGMIAAFASCITGYLLSISDDYDKATVNWHQWMGIGVAVFSLLFFLKVSKFRIPVNEKILAAGLLLLIFVAGHLGGSLTHGSDYLTKPLADVFGRDSVPDTIIKPLPNVQDAYVYRDVIRPIFQTRCYGCHGAKKQKGKLRLDDSLWLMKGGKDGKVIEPGNAQGSELIKRLLLPVDNEDHMPPKEKPQPSESQITLLKWWISQGADFNKKVEELQRPDQINHLLLALQRENIPEKKTMDIPEEKVDQADGSILDKIKQQGIVVLPVAQNSNWLMADFVTDQEISNEVLHWLPDLKKQLIWLKMAGTNINDRDMAVIAQLENLRWLNLQNTSITDKGLASVQTLVHLQYLNLVGTKVTVQGVLQLKRLKSLHSLYLYRTNISRAEWPALQMAFPKTRIDSGGYLVPMLVTDTIVVKAKKE